MQPAGYLVGLTDGEGCFTINIRKWKKNKSGYSVSATFSIQMVATSRPALELAGKMLACGTIVNKVRVPKNGNYQPSVQYHVTNLRDITQKVIPFFNEHPLTVKEHDFELWKEAIALIVAKVHLTREGIDKIHKIRTQMNFRLGKSWKYPPPP